MKIAIAQATILAYLAKNAELHAQLPADETAKNTFVGERLGAVLQYFKAHANRDAFFVTADDMVFHAPEHATLAANHANGLDVKVVCQVYRSDVAAELAAEPSAAEQAAAAKGNDYGSMNVGQLRLLLTERGITFNEKDRKADLIQLLLDNTGKVAIEPDPNAVKTDEGNGEANEGTEVKDGEAGELDAPAPIDYEAMKVPELKEEAKKLGIIVIDAWKKADIIAAIKATLDGTGNIQK